MRLSKEQIALIDETLVLNKVIYDDIKLELTDHIASDIEEIMTNEDVSFEIALKEALGKWKKQLKKEKRWFWGPPSQGKLPKLIMFKWVEQFKRFFLYSILLSMIITSLILGILKISENNQVVIDFINNVYTLFWILVPVLLVIGRKTITKSQRETTFKYIYLQMSFPSVYMFLLPIIGLRSFHIFPIFKHVDTNSYVFVFFLLVVNFTLVNPLLLFRFLYKHFQFEKTLSKV